MDNNCKKFPKFDGAAIKNKVKEIWDTLNSDNIEITLNTSAMGLLCFALGIGLFALGAALGLIRVILGVHFIRDVVAGALIGVISGAVGLLTLTLI